MIVSIKHKFVFLCVTKCASTAIEHALTQVADIRLSGIYTLKHLSYSGFQRLVVPLLRDAELNPDEMKVYCMVREPISWLQSWLRFRQRPDLQDPSHPYHELRTTGLSFEEFFELWETGTGRRANVGTQRYFLTDREGNVSRHIRAYRYEDIGSLVTALETHIGQKLPIEIRNKSPEIEVGDYNIDLNRPRIRSEYELYNQIER